MKILDKILSKGPTYYETLGFMLLNPPGLQLHKSGILKKYPLFVRFITFVSGPFSHSAKSSGESPGSRMDQECLSSSSLLMVQMGPRRGAPFSAGGDWSPVWGHHEQSSYKHSSAGVCADRFFVS